VVRKIGYRIGLLSLLSAVAAVLPAAEQVSTTVRFLRFVLLGAIGIELGLLFEQLVFRVVKADWLRKIATSLFATLLLLVSLEAVFMCVARSHGTGASYAARLWVRRYWHPINSYGFRDQEPAHDKRKSVFFVGDSFTAGHGIDDPADRFSDIVGTRLAATDSGVQVLNLGQNGADTRAEFKTMMDFIGVSGIAPDVLVLEYYGNDIEVAAQDDGLVFSGIKPYEELSYPIRSLVRGSYLANFVYWQFPEPCGEPYTRFLTEAYSSPVVFDDHLRDVMAFVGFAKSRNIPLVVAVFPFLSRTELSDRLYGCRLEAALRDEGADVLDVASVCARVPQGRRTINVNDGHPSVAVNACVADALFEIIQRDVRLASAPDSGRGKISSSH
jgi:hypothetical protein